MWDVCPWGSTLSTLSTLRLAAVSTYMRRRRHSLKTRPRPAHALSLPSPVHRRLTATTRWAFRECSAPVQPRSTWCQRLEVSAEASLSIDLMRLPSDLNNLSPRIGVNASRATTPSSRGSCPLERLTLADNPPAQRRTLFHPARRTTVQLIRASGQWRRPVQHIAGAETEVGVDCEVFAVYTQDLRLSR